MQDLKQKVLENLKNKGYHEYQLKELNPIIQATIEATKKALNIANVSHRFSKEDLWDAWWASAIKTISFSGVNKEYERRCFEKFYENKLSSSNGG